MLPDKHIFLLLFFFNYQGCRVTAENGLERQKKRAQKLA